MRTDIGSYSAVIPKKPERVDAELWQKRDQAVEEARSSTDPGALRAALAGASRWSEAHQSAIGETEKSPTNAQHWADRAWTGLAAGAIDDAKKAACEARRLQPDQDLPSWAMADVLPCPAP